MKTEYTVKSIKNVDNRIHVGLEATSDVFRFDWSDREGAGVVDVSHYSPDRRHDGYVSSGQFNCNLDSFKKSIFDWLEDNDIIR